MASVMSEFIDKKYITTEPWTSEQHGQDGGFVSLTVGLADQSKLVNRLHQPQMDATFLAYKEKVQEHNAAGRGNSDGLDILNEKAIGISK